MTLLSKIEGPGCGCDARDVQDGAIPIDAAFARIAGAVAAVSGTEAVALEDALGRILAVPVHAGEAVPPFDNAAMDGYAIRSADLAGPGPWCLPVAARIAAGRGRPDRLTEGAAAQIFTGAPIPEGADTVVMQEAVERCEDSIVLRRRVAAPGHIRKAGEDMPSGAPILPAGHRLTARSIAACAAAGAASVVVRRRARVALLVTGDEVTAPGRAPAPAGIHDVNTPMLRAALSGPDVALIRVETGRDTRADLARQLCRIARDVDLVVTTGGISVGAEDHVKPALASLGAAMIFSGVTIKPGKPVSFGRLGKAFWLGLPGNPLSAFVTWQMFGTAIRRRLAGDTGPGQARGIAVLDGALCHKPGRCELRLATIAGIDGQGRTIVRTDAATHSARVSTLPLADGVILIPAEADTLPAGALVEFQPFCD